MSFSSFSSMGNWLTTTSGDVPVYDTHVPIAGYIRPPTNSNEARATGSLTTAVRLGATFTIEFFMVLQTNTGPFAILSIGPTTRDGVVIYYNNVNGQLQFQNNTPSAAGSRFNWHTTGLTLVTNRQYHVAIVKDGLTCAIYVDGYSMTMTNASTDFNVAINNDQTSNQVSIGRNNETSNPGYGLFKHNRIWVTNIRGTNKKVYTGNFTRPLNRLERIQPAETNIQRIQAGECVFLFQMNNSENMLRDEIKQSSLTSLSAALLEFIPLGPPHIIEGYVRPPDSSIGYATGTLTSAVSLGSTFTIEFFMNLRSSTGISTILSIGLGNKDGIVIFYNNISSQLQISNHTTSTIGSRFNWWTNTTFVTDRWYHIAMVKEETTCTTYVDGMSVLMNNNNNSDYNVDIMGGVDMRIGKHHDDYSNLANNRIWLTNIRGTRKRVYTGTFTRHTNRLERIQPAGTNIESIAEGECVFLFQMNNGDSRVFNEINQAFLTNTSLLFASPVTF